METKSNSQNVRNISWSHKPLLILGQILGLFHYPLTASKFKHISTLHLVYRVIVFISTLIATSAFLYYRVSYIYGQFKKNSSFTRALITFCWWIMFIVNGSCGYLLMIFKSVKLSRILYGYGLKEDYSSILESGYYSKSRLVANLSILFAISFPSVEIARQALMAAFSARKYPNNLHYSPLVWLICIAVADFQFVNLVYTVGRKQESVNVTIRDLMEREKRVYGFKEIRHMWFYDSPSASRTVRKIAWLDLRIREEVKDINEVFGLYIFVRCPIMMILLSFHAYYYIEVLIGSAKLEAAYIAIMDGYAWAFSSLVGFVFPVISCHSFARKAEMTEWLVSEYILKTEDHLVRRELRLLSDQLHHTKSRFTGSKFFNLDYGVLTSVSSTIMTYLAILVQFWQLNPN